ncbi:MAG TPA: type II toxin-antitoxin system VapC family toxin [Tepidisphaeraceae bacterium]|nr:type II toxin-antitoxin system VapC family toxin [Tepidisphaeraceae bacterium]
MSRGYLLDTNHLGRAVTPGGAVRNRIAALRSSGFKVGTCVPVLCEIEAGIQQVSHQDAYRADLARLLRQIRVWPITPATAKLYGAIYHDLRTRGRVLSQVDMMLAALARQMDLTLVTSDRDFSALTDPQTENWVIP